MQSQRFFEITHNRIDGSEALEVGIILSSAAVVLGDFGVPKVAGEKVGVAYGGVTFIVKERAERVVSVVILDSARFVDQYSNAAETVVQVEI